MTFDALSKLLNLKIENSKLDNIDTIAEKLELDKVDNNLFDFTQPVENIVNGVYTQVINKTLCYLDNEQVMMVSGIIKSVIRDYFLI